jgi:hypothetical protein
VQYFPPAERHLAVGFDVSYHRMKVDGAMQDLVKPSFVKAIALLRLQTR